MSSAAVRAKLKAEHECFCEGMDIFFHLASSADDEWFWLLFPKEK
ncbi:hypothetical protein [Acinetobacter gerneri]|nr:hypothetical protein [Acinetobacter gerneri]